MWRRKGIDDGVEEVGDGRWTRGRGELSGESGGEIQGWKSGKTIGGGSEVSGVRS
jgi:hypothetical protein